MNALLSGSRFIDVQQPLAGNVDQTSVFVLQDNPAIVGEFFKSFAWSVTYGRREPNQQAAFEDDNFRFFIVPKAKVKVVGLREVDGADVVGGPCPSHLGWTDGIGLRFRLPRPSPLLLFHRSTRPETLIAIDPPDSHESGYDSDLSMKRSNLPFSKHEA